VVDVEHILVVAEVEYILVGVEHILVDVEHILVVIEVEHILVVVEFVVQHAFLLLKDYCSLDPGSIASFEQLMP